MAIIDYFMQHLWQLWVLISLACLILELTNGDFFIMCFAIGGVFSAIAAALGFGGIVQVIVFALFTVLSLMFVRPVALRYLHRGEDKRVSNADALLGRIGVVSEAVKEGGYGRVAIDGDDWKAVSADGMPISKGDKVKVVGRESIIITVAPLPPGGGSLTNS